MLALGADLLHRAGDVVLKKFFYISAGLAIVRGSSNLLPAPAAHAVTCELVLSTAGPCQQHVMCPMYLPMLPHQGDEWEEKWGEHYHAGGKVAKFADKWGKAGANVWHERWGEDYESGGECDWGAADPPCFDLIVDWTTLHSRTMARYAIVRVGSSHAFSSFWLGLQCRHFRAYMLPLGRWKHERSPNACAAPFMWKGRLGKPSGNILPPGHCLTT